MNLLKFSEEFLRKKDALNTAREIEHQPNMWVKTIEIIETMQSEISSFISLLGKEYDILFVGAGTSEYIGNTIVPYYNQFNNFRLRSVPSTEVVADPMKYVDGSKNTLCFSFGRSGNSPESMGAIAAINAISEKVYHIYITCNKDGALAKSAITQKNTLAILLPDETNDISFAMTSSFTSMLLATMLVLDIDDLVNQSKSARQLAEDTRFSLEANANQIKNLCESFDFKRVVYLGSHHLKGISQESCLKILELTQGQINTLYDSPLGFRHGPKSFINPDSLIVLYLSDNPLTRNYEIDLINELNNQNTGYKTLVVTHDEVDIEAEIIVRLPNKNKIGMNFIALEMITIAHLIALNKSILCNITTDNPCPSGVVNRVVTGVTIHPVQEAQK